MKRSESSVLAERRRRRAAVTPSKATVRKVKFSPEEMAYDIPEDLSHLKFRRTRSGRTVVIDADVAKVFRDEAAVNRAMRKLIEAAPDGPRRKKSA